MYPRNRTPKRFRLPPARQWAIPVPSNDPYAFQDLYSTGARYIVRLTNERTQGYVVASAYRMNAISYLPVLRLRHLRLRYILPVSFLRF